MVALREPAQAGTRPFSLREYRELAERATPSADLFARTFFPVSLAADDGARIVQTEIVSGNYSPASPRSTCRRAWPPRSTPLIRC
jgi:hypothetical protein